jgi:hypothetical protein
MHYVIVHVYLRVNLTFVLRGITAERRLTRANVTKCY